MRACHATRCMACMHVYVYAGHASTGVYTHGMRACLCIRMMCMHVCVHTWHACTHAYGQMRVCTHRTCAHACVHVWYACTHVCTHGMYARMCLAWYACTNVCTHGMLATASHQAETFLLIHELCMHRFACRSHQPWCKPGRAMHVRMCMHTGMSAVKTCQGRIWSQPIGGMP